MTDVNLTWESLGSIAISTGALTLIGGAIVLIPGYFWIIGGIVAGVGVLGYLCKKAYEMFQRSKMKKWLRTQLESDTLSTEMRQKFAEMLAKLIE